jgi:raffinose/stachyose/melibiose transport system permease protein
MTELKGVTAAAGAPAAAVAPPTSPARRRHRPRRPRRQVVELVVLLGPALVLFATFVLLPICISAYYGLFNWTGYGPLSDFTGLHNYKLVLDDPVFRSSLLQT